MEKKRKSKGMGNEMKTLKKVHFELFAPEAKNVTLAGDFNDWDPYSHPMKKNSEGIWEINIHLTQGIYEYQFLVDRKWKNDSKNIIAI